MTKHKISVFFAYQFHSEKISKPDREVALTEAITEAQQEIHEQFPDYFLEWNDGRLGTGKHVGEQIADTILSCDIFIADITEFNRNVLFELGIAYALQRTLNKRVIWLIHESVNMAEVPSDIKGLFLARYSGQNLKPILTTQIRDSAREVIMFKKESGGLIEATDLLKRFWKFDGTTIDIVCSVFPQEERQEYAEPLHRNYLRYAMFADLDSLFHVATNITKLFPYAIIRPFAPTEYADLGSQKGLIVIGGPPWNSKSKEIQSLLPLRFIENVKGVDNPLEIDNFRGYVFRPTHVRGKPSKDISVFARFQNKEGMPHFWLTGCLTYGVLGAARSFLNGYAFDNAEFVETAVHDQDFILVFETEIDPNFPRTGFSHVRDPLVLMSRKRPGSVFEVVVENVGQYESKS